ncbi:MAG: cytochrome c-type biogenesis protein CcmH [Deltaproteobacteria bacterium]|nr:cytochrome c-type biogenesis protein CcmH [Deltaproteobacteria bacterium]
MNRLILVFFILFFSMAHAAAQLTPEQESRANQLGRQLRCPVCRGVSIAESPAELAQQMMTLVRAQVAEGKTDQEILKYFEERYGEWALLQPKAEGMNLLVWVLPALFILVGAGLIVSRTRKEKTS